MASLRLAWATCGSVSECTNKQKKSIFVSACTVALPYLLFHCPLVQLPASYHSPTEKNPKYKFIILKFHTVLRSAKISCAPIWDTAILWSSVSTWCLLLVHCPLRSRISYGLCPQVLISALSYPASVLYCYKYSLSCWPPGLGFFCPPVPEAVYNIPTLRLNINSTLFGLLAQASYGGWLAAA